MHRPISDWGGNLIAFAIVVFVNVLSNALPINGQTMPEISAKYPSLFTPAGIAFSIWGLIYLLLLGFVVYQALPAQRTNAALAAISPWFKINCAANASWIVAWHYDLLAVSLVLMLTILATLVLLYRELLNHVDEAGIVQHLGIYVPFSLYIGWITVATIANASVLQTAYAWDNVGLTAIQWTLVKLALAGAIGAVVIARTRDIVFVLVIAWGGYGIYLKQSATPAVSGAALTLSLLALMLAANEGLSRLRRN